MNTNLRIALFAIFLLFNAFQIQAFSPDNHEYITRQAVKLLREQYHISISPEQENDLVRGNRKQDMFIDLSRIWNMHFMNYHKQFDACDAVQADRRIANRCERLKRSLDANCHCCNKGNRCYKKHFYRIGALAHYLQDATCPPHVCAIYHGLPVTDAFDKCDVSKLLPLELTTFDINKKRELSAYCQIDSVIRIITDHTLQSISSPNTFNATQIIGKDTTFIAMPWSAFWLQSDDYFFTRYGMFSRHYLWHVWDKSYFGTTDIWHKGIHYLIDTKQYENFQRARVAEAVTVTAQLIYYNLQ